MSLFFRPLPQAGHEGSILKNMKHVDQRDINAIIIVTSLLSTFFLYHALDSAAVSAKEPVEPVVIEPDKIIVEVPYKPETIKDIVKMVFGKHADDAFKLLECENKDLNPSEKHTNDDGSVDYGLFQLNSYWHGFNRLPNNDRYLTDPMVNAAMAYRLYVESGYSFRLWTCWND